MLSSQATAVVPGFMAGLFAGTGLCAIIGASRLALCRRCLCANGSF